MAKVKTAPIAQSPGAAKQKRTSSITGKKKAASSRVVRSRAAETKLAAKQPLRRRVLEQLAQAPATPSALAEILDSANPSISRLLSELRAEALVVKEGDQSDRRSVSYSLTEAGEVALNRQVAFGPRQTVEIGVDQAERIQLLREAKDRAVTIRREANRLEESRSRLRAVIRESEKLGEEGLALESMAELAKTLRQNRAPEDQDTLNEELETVIGRLNSIALGGDPGFGAEFALPAAAHLKYTLGRSGRRRGIDLATRETYLTAACSLYGQLVQNTRQAGTSDWLARQTWSVMALAGNLRKQTQLERALSFATVAKRSFDVLEDRYGTAQCFLMFGFCLRLLGEFLESSACLDKALEIAEANSYHRISADTLMQKGEVMRCLGALEEASTLLEGAVEQSQQSDLMLTEAFAQSALGAVRFQTCEFGAAQIQLAMAAEKLQACGHVEGMALNSRRQAAVARSIATESASPKYAEAERLIRSSLEGYSDLRIPAGVVACQVETGYVQMLRKRGRVTPVIKDLTTMLASPSKSEILKLDPWVPRLLKQFAVEVEDDHLVSESNWLLAEAQKILAEKGAESIKRIASVMDDMEREDEDEIDLRAAEMGGEARRDPGAFEVPNLTEDPIHEPLLAA